MEEQVWRAEREASVFPKSTQTSSHHSRQATPHQQHLQRLKPQNDDEKNQKWITYILIILADSRLEFSKSADIPRVVNKTLPFH